MSVFQRPVLCGFTVVIDTREQQPYDFRGIKSDYKTKYADLIVPTARKALGSGDYSIAGLENRVAIERKSKKDLYGTLGSGRERFVKELERLNQYDFAAVVVECPWTAGGILKPPKHSKMPPKTVVHSIFAWQVRYRIHWLCVADRDLAEIATFRLLEKFWREWQGR